MKKSKKSPQENPNNIVYYCPEHAPEPIDYSGPLEELVGLAVKVRFTDPKVKNLGGEHMWVKIHSVIEDKLAGKLANQPSFMTNIKFGDPVLVERQDIEAVYPPDALKKAG